MSLLGAVLLLSCLPSALIEFAIPKWQADKNVRIEDAYKYLYQATRGGEHAAPDRESAKVWLDNEWQALGPAVRGEPRWEPLCPRGEIGRLNLRPFRNAGGKPDDLLDAFLASARDYRSEPATFISAWDELGERLKMKRVGDLDHEAWKKLDTEMKKKNYPAIHHSDAYKQAYRPAYRVITIPEMRKLLKH